MTTGAFLYPEIKRLRYIGRSRQAKNSRFIYAIAIDLDGIEQKPNIIDLFYQIDNEILPRPTYTVYSGTGVHLYYQLENPIPCFNNITKQLADLKLALTKKIWNRYVTIDYEKPQLQSLFQGFRMVGGVTGGNRTSAYLSGKPVSIDYLNSFVPEENQVKQIVYKSNLTLRDAKEKYPEWYESRIVNKRPKGTWQCKRDLYDWWKNKLKQEILEGHRYFGIMCLSVYAKKCGISEEELQKDAFELQEMLDKLTTREVNRFTREDILAALEMYNDNYITFPINSISNLTNIPIDKNKRNYRKQDLHLQLARANKQILKAAGEMKPEGRPSKAAMILEWRTKNPGGTKAEYIKETMISKPTVYKHWDCI